MTSPYSHPQHDLATVLEAVERGHTITGAAKVLQVTPKTMHRYTKRWAQVAAAIRDKRNELVDLAELSLRAAVLKGEPWACALVLKTQGKDRGYVERTEITGADGESINIRLKWDE